MYYDVDEPKAVNAWCLLLTSNKPSQRRLKKRHEFLRIQRVGQRFKAAFVVLIIKSTRTAGRFGLTVAKTVGKAHVRNLIKRRLRHILRKHPDLFEHRDLVVLALPEAANASFQQLEKDLLKAHEGLRSRHRP